MKCTTPIVLENEKQLAKEVLRALKFIETQLNKGWTMTEALTQMEGSYGGRVSMHVAEAFARNLKNNV